MPQTLLALLALVIVTALTLQTGRHTIDDQATSSQLESVAQSRGVAVMTLERLASLPFDGGEGVGSLGLTPEASFGAASVPAGTSLDELLANDPALGGGFDDLDDFDGVAGAISHQIVTDPETGLPVSYDLMVDIDVDYAASGGAGWEPVVAPIETPHKLVTVTIRHASLAAPIQFARVYAAR